MSDPLVDIALELYSGPPDQFVARRNAYAAESGDAEVATAIRALRKPTLAAWVVNVFARERSSKLDEALQLAQELRDAQADLDAATLAQLGRERRALTARLASDASALATARGGSVSAATLEAVRQTISAAFFDEAAAAAVSSGRLVHELEPSTTSLLELAEVVGGGAVEPRRVAEADPVDEVSARRERRRAERLLHDAEKQHAKAQNEHRSAEQSVREKTRRHEQLLERIAELEAELQRLHPRADDAAAEVERATENARETQQRLHAAEAALDEARAAVASREGDHV